MIPESRLTFTSPLTDEQRIKRICELLWKAVVRTEASRALAAPAPQPLEQLRAGRSIALPALSPDESDDARIVNYLALVGGAAPVRIRATLGISRWSFHSALHRLLSGGRIVAAGRSRSLTYRLSESQLAAAKIGAN